MTEELSIDEERALDELVQRVRRNSLCTDAADRETAEAVVAQAYEAAGCTRPRRFAWCGSPVSARTVSYLRATKSSLVPEASREIVELMERTGELGDDLQPRFLEARRALGAELEEKLGRRLTSHGVLSGSHFANDIWRRLSAGPLRDFARLIDMASDRDRASAILQASGESACLLSVWVGSGGRHDLTSAEGLMDGFGGQLELPWAEHYRFLHRVLGCFTDAQVRRLDIHAAIAETTGPWWPFRNVCLMSERPSRVLLDDRGLAHGTEEAAIAYDGWQVWALEGVLVDEEIVRRPESITLARIQNEQNEEVRRLLISRYGWERYLGDTKAGVLDMDADPDGILRALMKAGEHVLLVCACTSTGRPYTMEVEPGCRTCAEAAQWLAGGGGSKIIAQS